MGTKSGDLSASEESIEHAPRYAPRTRSGVRAKYGRDGRSMEERRDRSQRLERPERQRRGIFAIPIPSSTSSLAQPPSLLPPTHSCEGRRRFSRDFVGRGMFNDGRMQKRGDMFAKLRYITACRDKTHRQFFATFPAWTNKNSTRETSLFHFRSRIVHNSFRIIKIFGILF